MTAQTAQAGAWPALRRSAAALPALALLALAALPLPSPAQAPPRPGEYLVVDGRVDGGTFNGWRMFHTACFACHGVDATGTDRAPDLRERVRAMTPRAFAAKVLTSYRITLPAGDARSDDSGPLREALLEEVMRQQRGGRGQVVMPAWEENPQVSPHVLDLYAYLSARADGRLGPGRPRLIDAPR